MKTAEQAKEYVENCLKTGSKPKIKEQWVIWTPALPSGLMMESFDYVPADIVAAVQHLQSG